MFVQVIVLDEADTMFDRGFGPEVRAVLKPARSKAHPARCILVLATLSKVSAHPAANSMELACSLL